MAKKISAVKIITITLEVESGDGSYKCRVTQMVDPLKNTGIYRGYIRDSSHSVIETISSGTEAKEQLTVSKVLSFIEGYIT